MGNVTLTNRSVDESLVVSQLNKEIKSLEDQNILTQARIAESGSLTLLAERIAQAGYVDNAAIVALPNSASMALR
ncbi:MAG: hypothetical protein UX62_C0002G0025 [Microgenomates group bacterium GW2011_GWA2_46_7]|nr:MAG: hypothetical protein UX62_C0002G0025 [Microgenomates group bacterium GW2011_GWA2_46_7]